MPMQQDPPDQPSPRSPDRLGARKAAAYLLALAFGIAAAWWIHVSFVSPNGETVSRNGPSSVDLMRLRPESARDANPTTQAHAAPPWSLRASADSRGLVETAQDPGGIEAPAGAVRRWAYRRDTAAGSEAFARYESAATAADVLAHYDRVAKVRDLLRFGQEHAQAGHPGRGSRIYVGTGRRLTVRLRPMGPEGKMLLIAVTHMAWPDGRAGHE